MDDLEILLPRIRGAWMAGRSALEHCPPDWRGAIDEGGGDAALAALVGHAIAVAFRPAPAEPPEPRPLLPRLAAPSIAGSLRPRVQRILAARKCAPNVTAALLTLLAARGVSIHPADWLPGAHDEWVPDLYAPWLDWASGGAGGPSDGTLTIESYDDFPWAARLTALAQLRRTDPAAARAIVAEKAPAEPAERRVKLLEILQTGLSEADFELLEGFAADRSDRVKGLTRDLLARLAGQKDDSALAAELAQTVALSSTGLLKRRHWLNVEPLKTNAQKARRAELFGLVSLSGLAAALGAEDVQLVERVPSGDAAGIAAFFGMVARTGSDAALRGLLDRVLEDGAFSVARAPLLAERLTPDERRQRLPAMLSRDDQSFETSLAFAGPALGAVGMGALVPTPGWAALLLVLDSAIRGEEAERPQANATIQTALRNLGFLLTADAAGHVIQLCVAGGLSFADPRLELLHLNAALKPETMP
jgi:hypothetical protein